MVDRPSKRQGPGARVRRSRRRCARLAGWLDRPSVRTRPADDRAGRGFRPSYAGGVVIRSTGSARRPAPPPSAANPSRPRGLRGWRCLWRRRTLSPGWRGAV